MHLGSTECGFWVCLTYEGRHLADVIAGEEVSRQPVWHKQR
jgi:hypothetical protein